jgi:hypothetical protein
MKKTLTLGTLILCGCLVAWAQLGSSPNQTPPASTPSTFPQDPTGQGPSSQMPPDTSAESHEQGTDAAQDANQNTGQESQASNTRPATVEGCLSQSSEGDFMLADNSGNKYRLRGESSQLSSYIGNQVQVDGSTLGDTSSAGSTASTSSGSGQSSNGGTAAQLNVVSVHKLADTCMAANSTR